MSRSFRTASIALGLLLLISGCFHSENKFQIKKGDLLFQDLDCGPVCDAIESVTHGIDGADLSHVAIVSRIEKGKVYVVEAFSEGVEEVKFDDFVSRAYDKHHNPKILVGRVKLDQKLIDAAVGRAMALIGHKYDPAFDISDNRYYCSELLYEAFRDADSKPIFELNPMTFIDPKTQKTSEAWIKYFKDINTKIPEGGMGLNPGSISRSKYVDIVYSYGCPAKWTKCKY